MNRQTKSLRGPTILCVAAILALFSGVAGRFLQGSGDTLLGVAGDVFQEVSDSVGFKFKHVNGKTDEFYLAEMMGGGVALFDFDGDGDLDIFLVQSGGFNESEKLRREKTFPNHLLLRNDLIATPGVGYQLRFVDVTTSSGIVRSGYGMGVTVGDFNNDGSPDLYITNLGVNQLLRNNGDGTFTDVTSQSGTGDPLWSTSAAFFDFDGDGWLDLYVTNYVNFSPHNNPRCLAANTARDYCGPQAFQPQPDRLYRNRGDGTFEDVTGKSGILAAYGPGLGVVTADFNGSGWIDVFVANDGTANQLWINRGDGGFEDRALLSGVAFNRMGRAEAGMGVDAGDFDGDGDEDLFLTHLNGETNTLYENDGAGFFEDRTNEAGLGLPSFPLTGFGGGWIDLNNNGWLDLVAVNGAVQIIETLALQGDPHPLGQINQIFMNRGDGTFADVSRQGGESFQQLEVSRGAAFGDMNNDGKMDLVVTNNGGPARLLLNQVEADHHWIGLRLESRHGARAPLGARVQIVLPSGRSLWRRVRSDGSYLSSSDSRVLVGTGSESKADVVKVLWPSGHTEEFKDINTGRYTILVEGSGESQP